MMKLKSCIPGAAGVLLLSAVLTSTASPLVQRDLLAPGDGLLTYDPMTGAEWLDMTATAGMSYNQVRASDFYTKYGFKHADGDKVYRFYLDAIPNPNPKVIWATQAEMLADPWAHQVLEWYRIFSGKPGPEFKPGDWDYAIIGLLSDGFSIGDGPFVHWTAKWWLRVTHETPTDFPEWYSIWCEWRPTIVEIEEDKPFTSGHFLVRGPEQVDTLWLLLPVTGLLFLSRFRRLGQPT